VAVHSTQSAGACRLSERYPGVKVAASEDQILSDPAIQLVASAAIPDFARALGVRGCATVRLPQRQAAMTTLAQLAEGPPAVKETAACSPSCTPSAWKCGRGAGGQLVTRAPSESVQTVNLAPHR